MEQKKHRGAMPPRPDKRKLFPAEQKALQKAGLNTDDLIFFVRGDMDNALCFCDQWLCFDGKGLYLAQGSTEIKEKKRHGKKRPELQVTIRELQAIPLEDIDCLLTERLSFTGSLLYRKGDELCRITRFSVGNLGKFDDFVHVFNSFKETGVPDFPNTEKKEGKCKKCGAPCPPGKEYCRRHSKKSATAARLFTFFGGYLPQVAVIIFVMLLGAAASVLIPQVSTRALFDDILANPQELPAAALTKALATLVLSIFGIKLLQTGLTVLQQYITASVMPKVTYDIKVKIFRAMQRLSVNFYSSKQTGALMERVTRDSNNIYWFFIDGVPSVIIDAATILGVLTVMFLMSWKLSLLVITAIPVIMAFLIFGDKLFRGMHHRSWVFRSKLSSIVSDNINGQRIIKAFAKEDDEYTRFEKISDDFRDSELKLALSEATVFPLLEVVVLILSTVVLGLGGVMAAKNEITVGTLLSYIVYLEMLREPFDFLSWVSNWWSRCADSAQRVFEICDAEPDITEKENAVGFENLRGDIELRELDFEYEPARPVIKQLNLSVKSGEMLGIVGKTGAGKTTIANLIARLYDAKRGSVTIDGIDVKDLKLSELRTNIGLVSQDIYLFIGTVADNIRYAKPDASMDEVIAAAKAASAHDFIMKLPQAYETRVGAGGQKLSGGERQRISIARTIIQNPKILILDEATAAMDTATERNIQESLSKLKKGRTTLAIAHRLSTLRDADYLAVISSGTIAEYGTFTELIKQKGEFYKQYKIQFEALKAVDMLGGGTVPEKDNDKEEDKHG